MYTITITGPRRAIDIANWLKDKNFNYKLTSEPNNPFNGKYTLSFNDYEQAVITSLTWGLTK
jgi:hypothetical protein